LVGARTVAKNNLKILIYCAAALLLYTGTPHAADLDDPVARPLATLRTEIDRGMSATPNPLDFDILNYDDAIHQILNYTKQRYTDTAALEFGLYYKAWHELWRLLSDGFYRRAADAQLARTEAKLNFVMARQIQKNLGLTDAQVKEVAHPYYVDGQERFEEMAKAGNLRGTYPDRLAASKSKKSKGK
jgi:hypothetical protein